MASSDEEDKQLAKQQLHIREMDRKANFEATQSEIRRQKENLQQLRRENKELTTAKQVRAKGATTSAAGYEVKERGLLSTKLYQKRRELDDLKSSNRDLAGQIKLLTQKKEDLDREAQPILDEGNPLTQKIRTLENRLDKALIKHNEAMSIRRTYEGILKRLRSERVGFDNQLAAIEKTLKAKEHDFMELSNMAHDAHHAKEIAKAEVVQFKASYAEERRQKKKELEDRKAFVQKRMDEALKADKAAKQKRQQEEQQTVSKQEEEEKRRRDLIHSTVELRSEEEQERLAQYADLYYRIKEVMRATNIDDVLARWEALKHTHATLDAMTSDAKAKIQSLHRQKADLQRKCDENKYSGSGQLGSRRIVDEFETHLVEAKAQLAKSSDQHEVVSKQFAAVKAGVEHLAEKLSTYRPEMQTPPMTDDNIVEVLRHIEQKLQMLVDEAVMTNEQIEEMIVRSVVELPTNNLRIVPHADSDEEEEDRTKGEGKGEMEDAEDDPHDRVALKQMSLSAVERETKKNRKRNRKKDEEGVRSVMESETLIEEEKVEEEKIEEEKVEEEQIAEEKVEEEKEMHESAEAQSQPSADPPSGNHDASEGQAPKPEDTPRPPARDSGRKEAGEQPFEPHPPKSNRRERASQRMKILEKGWDDRIFNGVNDSALHSVTVLFRKDKVPRPPSRPSEDLQWNNHIKRPSLFPPLPVPISKIARFLQMPGPKMPSFYVKRSLPPEALEKEDKPWNYQLALPPIRRDHRELAWIPPEELARRKTLRGERRYTLYRDKLPDIKRARRRGKKKGTSKKPSSRQKATVAEPEEQHVHDEATGWQGSEQPAGEREPQPVMVADDEVPDELPAGGANEPMEEPVEEEAENYQDEVFVQ